MAAEVQRRGSRAWEIAAALLLAFTLFGSAWGYFALAARNHRTAPRGWSPEQATGEPDTNRAGDIPTAWASLSPDGQDEWLELEYLDAVVPSRVRVYETFNPGAVGKVTAFKEDGTEVVAWTGKDPTPISTAGTAVSTIPLRVSFPVNRIRVYLKSRVVPGWNEIDAVALDDASGQTQWAVAARASSSYADR